MPIEGCVNRGHHELGDYGEGVKQDDSQAIQWYSNSKVAEQGDSSAQYNLANMYNFGNRVKQDYKTAR